MSEKSPEEMQAVGHHAEPADNNNANEAAVEIGGGGGGGVPLLNPAAEQLTWDKLSPSEFQQLQDLAACT